MQVLGREPVTVPIQPRAGRPGGAASASSASCCWQVTGGGSPGRLCPTAAEFGCPAVQGSHRASSQRVLSWVLQPAVLGAEEDRRSQSSHRFVHAEPAHGGATLQDGNPGVRQSRHPKPGVDSLHRHPISMSQCTGPSESILRFKPGLYSMRASTCAYADYWRTSAGIPANHKSAPRSPRADALFCIGTYADVYRRIRSPVNTFIHGVTCAMQWRHAGSRKRGHLRWLLVHTRMEYKPGFMVNKRIYQFTCLPFRLATSPREFIKLLRPVVAMLRKRDVKLHVYLDDWLILADTPEQAQLHARMTISLIQHLGWIITSSPI